MGRLELELQQLLKERAVAEQRAVAVLDAAWKSIDIELQRAMAALVGHSARAKEELDDHFDAKWIEQQAEAGCLTTELVQGLIRFLVRKISSWQAPADDEDTRVWAEGVERTLERTAGSELGPFISEHLIDFLQGAVERLGKVYQRLQAMSTLGAAPAGPSTIGEALGGNVDQMAAQD